MKHWLFINAKSSNAKIGREGKMDMLKGNIYMDRYLQAESGFDLVEQAECVLAALDCLKNNSNVLKQDQESLQNFLNSKIRILLWAVLKALQEHQGDRAWRYLHVFPDNLLEQGGWFPCYRYYYGLILYEQRRWNEAAIRFQEHLQKFPEDEIASFFLGNCLAFQGDYVSALEKYGEAVSQRKSFHEAIANMGLIFAGLGDETTAAQLRENNRVAQYMAGGDLVHYPWGSSMLIQEDDMLAVHKIPIFINSRDRMGCLEKLIQWLWKHEYHNIYVLDNDSTYPALLNYYQALEQKGIFVIYLRRNFGHKALWDSGILEKLNIETPYIYTDSDILLSAECPDDVIERCLMLLRRNPLLKKVGLGLQYDDITFYNKEFIQNIEGDMYHNLIDKDTYFSGVDTTFAVYRNYRHYHIYESARLAGPYMAYHLPWYYDYDNLPEDEAYYLEHANGSSTLKAKLEEMGRK